MSKSFEEITVAPRAHARDDGLQAAGRVGTALARHASCWAAVAVAALMAACGGGGGGSGGGSNTVSLFPLQQAYKEFLTRDGKQSFDVIASSTKDDGSTTQCTGTADVVRNKPQEDTFVSGTEKRPAQAIRTETETTLQANCTLGGIEGFRLTNASSTQYFEVATSAGYYGVLGAVNSGSHARYESPPGTLTAVFLPDFVEAGKGGTLGTQYIYAKDKDGNANLSAPVASSTLSYLVTEDDKPGGSVLVTLTSAISNTDRKLFQRRFDTYRLDRVGTLTLLLSEIEFLNFNPHVRVVLTPRATL